MNNINLMFGGKSTIFRLLYTHREKIKPMTNSSYLILMTLVCTYLSTSSLSAQDPLFSQFFANKLYLNPAYAGFDPGTTVTLNYRDQWFGLPGGTAPVPVVGTGFRTINATANLQVPCLLNYDDVNLGMAVSVFSDEAGTGPLRTSGFGFALSHEQPLIRDIGSIRWLRRLDFRIGAHWSFMQKRLTDNNLIYSFQLDPVVGLLDGMNPFMADLRSNTYFNMNVGLLLRGSFGKVKMAENLFTIGYSMSNITEPNISLVDADDRVTLPKRHTFYIGTVHRITQLKGVFAPYYISPHFRWDRQMDGKLNTVTIGGYIFQKAYYGGVFIQQNFPNNYTSADVSTLLPTSRRNTSVLILNAGFDIRTVMDSGKPWRKRDSGIELGISYDINLGGLNTADTGGVLELSLSVNFVNPKRQNCDFSLGTFEIYNGKCPTRF